MLGRRGAPFYQIKNHGFAALFGDTKKKVIYRAAVEISSFVEAFPGELSQNFNMTLKAKYQSHNQIVPSMDID